MSHPRAFLSFDFDHDLNLKNLFAGQAVKDSPTPFTVQDWSSKNPLPQATWEYQIGQKIATTNMLIVLVGRSMTTASGVAKEISMATRHNVPVFGVYIDGANSAAPLPAALPRNRVIGWTWPNVGAAVLQMMGEGKNA